MIYIKTFSGIVSFDIRCVRFAYTNLVLDHYLCDGIEIRSERDLLLKVTQFFIHENIEIISMADVLSSYFPHWTATRENVLSAVDKITAYKYASRYVFMINLLEKVMF